MKKRNFTGETTRNLYRLGREAAMQMQGCGVMTENEIARELGMKRQLVHFYLWVALGKIVYLMRRAVGQ